MTTATQLTRVILAWTCFILPGVTLSAFSEDVTNGPWGSGLTVAISANTTNSVKNEYITVTLTFSNKLTEAVSLCGPFMYRSAGVCGSITVDGHDRQSFPYPSEQGEHGSSPEAPREIRIGPGEAKAITRGLTVDEKGRHSLGYWYVCDLSGKVAKILGIPNPSVYWHGILHAPAIEIEVK